MVNFIKYSCSIEIFQYGCQHDFLVLQRSKLYNYDHNYVRIFHDIYNTCIAIKYKKLSKMVKVQQHADTPY